MSIIGLTAGLQNELKPFANDADGNVYSVVETAGRRWLGENMRVGAVLTDPAVFPDPAGPITGWAPNGDPANVATMGSLYHWDMAMRSSTAEGARGIAPFGFYIPTDADWHALESYFATGTCDPNRNYVWDCDPAGTALKPGGSSGLNMLPAGYRNVSGVFQFFGAHPFLWSSTQVGSSAWRRYLHPAYTTVYRSGFSKNYGLSVRCVQVKRA